MAEEGPGKRHASKRWVLVMLGSELLLAVVCVYLLVRLWPHPTPSMRGAAPPAPESSTAARAADQNKDKPKPAGTEGERPEGTDTSPTTDTSATATDTTATDATDTTDTSTTTPATTGDEIPTTTSTSETPSGDRSAERKETGPGTADDLCTCEKLAEIERKRFRDIDRIERFDPSCVTIFNSVFLIWHEQRLLFLILLAGMLGGFVHALRSLYWYVGNRNLIMSWLPMYATLPFVGALMALIFYLVVRGGLFSPQSSIGDTSPFGFAAMATLVGMFSSRAAVKLQSIFDMLLTKPEEGANPSKNPAPAVSTITPSTVMHGGPAFDLKIDGTGFVATSQARADGVDLVTVRVTDTQLTAKVPATAIATANTAVKITVLNPAPGGGESNVQVLSVT